MTSDWQEAAGLGGVVVPYFRVGGVVIGVVEQGCLAEVRLCCLTGLVGLGEVGEGCFGTSLPDLELFCLVRLVCFTKAGLDCCAVGLGSFEVGLGRFTEPVLLCFTNAGLGGRGDVGLGLVPGCLPVLGLGDFTGG